MEAGAQILSPVLTAAAAESLNEYAQKRLFEPLGMGHTRFHEYPPGQVWTYADAETTLRDFAMIGQVVLDGGMHNGVQVLPRWWIDECLRPSERNRHYGYLWWIHYDDDRPRLLGRLLNRRRQPRPDDKPTAYATEGYLETDCYVLPSQGIVAARMQGRPKTRTTAYDREAALRLLGKVVP